MPSRFCDSSIQSGLGGSGQTLNKVPLKGVDVPCKWALRESC